MNSDQKMKETFIGLTMHSLLSLSVSFPFIFIICVDFFPGDMHPTEKKLQTNDTFIWIVTNVFSEGILFLLPHAPSVITHRSLRL